MAVGFLGLTYGFLTAPETVEEATAMVADAHHGEGHGDGHSDTLIMTTIMKLPPLMEKNMRKITTVNICSTNYKINLGLPSM